MKISTHKETHTHIHIYKYLYTIFALKQFSYNQKKYNKKTQTAEEKGTTHDRQFPKGTSFKNIALKQLYINI